MGNSGSSGRGASPAAPAPSTSDPSACPVKGDYKNPAIYNVYGERTNDPSASKNPLLALQNTEVLDPRNNMPLEPNQLPCPGQRKPLTTERVASNIPKGGTESTWVFPSPQMVFNALRRKDKAEDVTEDDMESFVHAHNGGCLGAIVEACT
jgi:cytochrome c heme-lyase